MSPGLGAWRHPRPSPEAMVLLGHVEPLHGQPHEDIEGWPPSLGLNFLNVSCFKALVSTFHLGCLSGLGLPWSLLMKDGATARPVTEHWRQPGQLGRGAGEVILI